MARQRKLSPECKAFIHNLIRHYNPQDAQDVQDMVKDLLGDTLQGMLEAEMDQKLGDSKYDYRNKETDDSRNGYSKKTVTSSFGDIELDIPRDRRCSIKCTGNPEDNLHSRYLFYIKSYGVCLSFSGLKTCLFIFFSASFIVLNTLEPLNLVELPSSKYKVQKLLL